LIKHLPNTLTFARLILAPVIAWAVWQAYLGQEYTQLWSILAAVLFIAAALTDLFDGMIARAFDAHSKFGRLIDPIADKALVGLPLIALTFIAERAVWPLWEAVALFTVIIVCRDLLMTWLRLTAKDGEGTPVSQLAKWKTAIELIAVAIPILLALAPTFGIGVPEGIIIAWIGFLGLAALLSAWTAYQYLAPKR
jgi:cardiolipin synthase (CMP-forming)